MVEEGQYSVLEAGKRIREGCRRRKKASSWHKRDSKKASAPLRVNLVTMHTLEAVSMKMQ